VRREPRAAMLYSAQAALSRHSPASGARNRTGSGAPGAGDCTGPPQLHEASEQDEADLVGRHVPAAPVVEVVLQMPIADAELELVEHLLLVEDVERVEHVEVEPLGENERVLQRERA
jgi:hypothetical protein